MTGFGLLRQIPLAAAQKMGLEGAVASSLERWAWRPATPLRHELMSPGLHFATGTNVRGERQFLQLLVSATKWMWVGLAWSKDWWRKSPE